MYYYRLYRYLFYLHFLNLNIPYKLNIYLNSFRFNYSHLRPNLSQLVLKKISLRKNNNH